MVDDGPDVVQTSVTTRKGVLLHHWVTAKGSPLLSPASVKDTVVPLRVLIVFQYCIQILLLHCVISVKGKVDDTENRKGHSGCAGVFN